MSPTTVISWVLQTPCSKETSLIFESFGGGRVAKVQELTNNCIWHYVDSANNPAKDLTRRKILETLIATNWWSQGPPFFLQRTDTWPERPSTEPLEGKAELWKATFCGLTVTSSMSTSLDDKVYNTWQEFMEATVQELQEQTPLQFSTQCWRVSSSRDDHSFRSQTTVVSWGLQRPCSRKTGLIWESLTYFSSWNRQVHWPHKSKWSAKSLRRSRYLAIAPCCPRCLTCDDTLAHPEVQQWPSSSQAGLYGVEAILDNVWIGSDLQTPACLCRMSSLESLAFHPQNGWSSRCPNLTTQTSLPLHWCGLFWAHGSKGG